MPLSTGQVLHDRYRIEEPLGQGGMGAVYRAWDVRLEVSVAIKENLDTSAELQRQFEREARILARLSHPSLPRVTDHFFIPGQGQYLVMDFVEGEDLGAMLRRLGALPEPQVLTWIMQICDALVYLHSQPSPIIHRDIKPNNIKIRTDGRAMLVDFGIAKVYDPQMATTLGAKAVTPGYSPPEQYGMGHTDARSDIYALGATLYHLLTGQAPPESVQRMGGQQMPPPRQINQQISPLVEQVILRAVEVTTDRRFQTVDELRTALTTKPLDGGRMQAPIPPDDGRTQVFAPPPSPAPPAEDGRTQAFTPPAMPARRLPRMVWVGAIAMVIVLIAGGFWLLGGSEGKKPAAEMPPAGTESRLPAPTAIAAQVAASPTQIAASPTAAATATEGPRPTATAATPTVHATSTLASPTAATPAPHKIAFASERDGNFEIYVMEADGSKQVNLTQNPAMDVFPAWSPDGQQIAFVSDRRGTPEVYVMKVDGSDLRQITDFGLDPQLAPGPFAPNWSPDGRQLVLTLGRSDAIYTALVTVDGSAEPVMLISNVVYSFPAWSPDGRQIAFVDAQEGYYDVYLMDADGSNVTPLHFMAQTGLVSGGGGRLSDWRITCSPYWSPDGAQVLTCLSSELMVAAGMLGSTELFACNVDGTGVTQLTDNKTEEDSPDWSPDGAAIIFSSEREGKATICTFPIGETVETCLIDWEEATYEWLPVWQPASEATSPAAAATETPTPEPVQVTVPTPIPTLASWEGVDWLQGQWSSGAPMAHTWTDHFAIKLLDGRVLVGGGCLKASETSCTTSADMELYDPVADTWSSAGKLSAARRTAGVILTDGRVLVAGGNLSSLRASNIVEIYDPARNTWEPVASLNEARLTQLLLLADGRVLAIGGEQNGKVLASAEVYDPLNDRWTLTGPLNSPRAGCGAALLADGRVLAAGGWVPGVSNTAELYDPATNSWSLTTNALSTGRIALRMAALPDGRALLIAGWANYHAVNKVDLYDPETNRWSQAAPLNTPRFNFFVATLPDGRVLVAGGDSDMTEDGKDTVNTVEVYDLTTHTWATLPGTMQQPRRDATLTVLNDGRLLITGGRNDGRIVYDLVDIYSIK